MFDIDKKIREVQEVVNQEIKNIHKKIDSIIEQMKQKWESDDQERILRYKNFMNTDLEFMEMDLDKTQLLYSIGEHLCEISAFIDTHKVPEHIITLFGITCDEYTNLYYNKTGSLPPCYELWKESAKMP